MTNIRSLIMESPDKIIEAASSAITYSKLLEALGVAPTNTRARVMLKDFLAKNNIELPKYDRHYHNLDHIPTTSLTKEDIIARLVKGDRHLGTVVRKWIIRFNLLPYQCDTFDCLLSNPENINWNGKKITLDLDHINGDNTDNTLANLRFLCPNCHSQTETYKGLNKRVTVTEAISTTLNRAEQLKRFKSLPSKRMLETEIEKYKSKTSVASIYGVSVYALNRKLQDLPFDDNPSHKVKASYPATVELVSLIEREGWEPVSRALGVTGNAVRKYLRNHGVDIKLIKSPFKTGPKSTQQNK